MSVIARGSHTHIHTHIHTHTHTHTYTHTYIHHHHHHHSHTTQPPHSNSLTVTHKLTCHELLSEIMHTIDVGIGKLNIHTYKHKNTCQHNSIILYSFTNLNFCYVCAKCMTSCMTSCSDHKMKQLSIQYSNTTCTCGIKTPSQHAHVVLKLHHNMHMWY